MTAADTQQEQEGDMSEQEQSMFDQTAEPVGTVAEQIGQLKTATNTAVQRRSDSVDQPATIDAESLITKAVEHNVPVESLERLLDMRDRLRAEQSREAYHAALAAFQAECPVITKSKIIPDKQGKERSRYAPLDDIVKQVRALLEKHGFSFSFDSELGSTEAASVKAICTIHHIAGHSESSSFTAHIDKEARMNTPQRDASAQTYAKRYAFMNALGILTADEDDDGGGAGAAPEPKPPQNPDAPQAPTRKQRQSSVDPEIRNRIRKAYEVWQADHTGDFNAFAQWAEEVAGVNADLSKPEAWTEKVVGEVETQLSRKQKS